MTTPRFVAVLMSALPAIASAQTDATLHLPAGDGPASGKRVVLIAGDEEYRSEEALPMLARVLAVHHGFDCRVLFHLDAASGAIEPRERAHVVGLEHLDDAELVVMALRFRRWADEDMARFVAYVEAGRPIVALRTSTHAFAYPRDDDSRFGDWSWDRSGGFGRRVLGETWVAHHGEHGVQGTRGVIEPDAAAHPILRGVRDVFGPTDVYAIGALPVDATVLLRGAIVAGLTPDAAAIDELDGAPRMPLVWTRARRIEGDRVQRVVCSTIGSADDFACEDLRRLVVNACYWAAGLEHAIPERTRVDPVGGYAPSPYGFGGHVAGITPAMLAIPPVPPRSR
ncbi:MAG: hypothetical protein HZB39_18720 [Planctomycetes bacterium]|nr:hypothetical protein [Planctomycetota bacterium]